ncbi:MAG: hypothetical protein IH898_14100 [Planctomycetes bacterium]|nr:hypothetical protein [Planctomycetota bacterium]
MATVEHYLDRYLDPVAQAFSPDVAQKIIDLRPDDGVLARVEQLGEKSDSGTLSVTEQNEYQSLADAGTLIALLKAKARRFLAQHST